MNLFNIVKDPLEFIQADIVLMMFIVLLKILLDLIILLNSRPMIFIMHARFDWWLWTLRVNLSQVNIVAQPNVLNGSTLIKRWIAAI
jgi:hypothetical protein